VARKLYLFCKTVTALLCLAVTAAPTLAQFETRSSTSTSKYVPTSLVVGDFNRDGKLDVAVVNYLPGPPGNVIIFLGNGDGTFAQGASYAVAQQPFYAATASLRNNGILDLVVGDSLSSYVYVMLGNGDGTFQSPIGYLASGEPSAVGIADFTNDGKLDIIAMSGAGGECGCVEVLPGNGDGTFGTAITTPIPYNITGFGMAIGNFNGDGNLDVAVSGGAVSTYQTDILLGNGDGSFTDDGYYYVQEDPYSVAAAHFTSGKNVGLAVGNDLNNSVSILLGNGDGTFQQAVNYATLGYTEWVAVGDFNGDGKEDLAAANRGSPSSPFVGSVGVLTGNGDGTFQPAVAYTAGEELVYVAVGDFNGDHQPDLVAVDELGDAVITLLNTGVVSFSPTTPVTFVSQLLGTSSPSQSVTLTNAGATTLTISSISLQGEGQFAESNTCGTSVAPGGNCTITVRSKPTVEGNSIGTVSIRDSASSKPQVIELLGAGTVVKFDPQKLTFPAQKVGTSSNPQSVQLTNTGSSTLDFVNSTLGTPIYITGDYKDFSETNTCGTSLNAGASCSISVTFSPKVKGTLTGSVVVSDTGGGSTQSFPISGTAD
jgi:hypothetical protein